ncbi:DEAD/DEAH box helicase family protein [Idiomarina baltica]|uniref:DNA repair helicase n=1 Tax=Idiomarina baltica OS145 TaxID=314276 RepID=A0ABP2CXL5_9GAMM|nr:DEAD/DEAH box helicase family protein [Idiomarina baltica]EAQ33278.1 putative DNA repair helicase [Idiomarina baltica OS145]
MDSTLEEISELKAIYFPSEVKVDTELFLPVAAESSVIDCMVGYFSSNFLSELAVTISTYLKNKHRSKLRFVVSPNLEADDVAKIIEANEKGQSYFNILFPDLEVNAEDLKSRSQEALAYLLYQQRVNIKIALKRNGIFHTKCWLFSVNGKDACIHGSSNATKGGLFNNFEQLVLSRSWMSSESAEICQELRLKFESIWSGDEQDIQTLTINEDTFNDIAKFVRKKSTALTDREIDSVLVEMSEQELRPYEKAPAQLQVPSFVKVDSGDFQHQGEAIRAWQKNSSKGILSIATGGGKTYTSLVAASRLQKSPEVSKLMIIVAVPTKTLMSQWERDIRDFNITPFNTSGISFSEIKSGFKNALRRLRLDVSDTEVVIVTHNLIGKGNLNQLIDSVSGKTALMIIADEVHNLGSEASQRGLTQKFDYRMGLSATHVRQFDEEGTDFLISYFGEVVYEFSLKDAIGKCLVPYNYYPHIVFLNAEEQDEFEALTYEINKLSFAQEEPSESVHRKRWEALCRKRRVLIESCSAKVSELHRILKSKDYSIKRALIFCTDKKPDQLEAVNSILLDAGVKFHQVTQAETASSQTLKDTLRLFATGDLDVLTSKRVLDEGFNVPQIETAFLLASNTVYRQWIQRLGRILRKSERTQKSIAHLHDFIVLPTPKKSSDNVDGDLSSLLKGELKRVSYFSELSSNYTAKDGGGKAVTKILELLGAL